MDFRGSTQPLNDPRGAILRLEELADVQFRHLAAAAEHTAQQVEAKRVALAAGSIAGAVSILVFGSWARDELTPGSDDDWAVLVGRPFDEGDPAVAQALGMAESQLGKDDRRPGAQAVFGVAFDIDELVGKIGLDADTNRNLTRRMMVLLESRELAGAMHQDCWRQILKRYLEFGIKDYRPRRFLVNDVVRYWRTICVDFEGKHQETGGEDPKWVTRNAKLRTSRKLLFAGGLLPTLMCHLLPEEDMPSFLENWLTAPAKDRLAAAFLHYDALDEGIRTFGAYDRWIAIMQDESARAELKTLRAGTRDESALWQDIRRIGEELQQGLIALLFNTPLRPLAPQYAIF